MLQVEMTATVREVTGKGAMRKLRAEGQTPAVIYGKGGDAISLQLDSKSLMKQLLEFYRKNTVVTMNIENGESKSVLIKEVQTDPIDDSLIHADFLEIDLETPRTFDVPLKYTGKAKGVDLGGNLVISLSSVTLKGKPLDIPDGCELAVNSLGLGADLKASAIELPAGVEMVTDADTVCVAVVAPAAK